MLSRRHFVSMSIGATFAGSSALIAFQNSNLRSRKRWVNTSGSPLDVPKGFTCKVIDRTGARMSDGWKVPGRPDGMGCFFDGTNYVLMRNHELSVLDEYPNNNPPSPEFAYDVNEFGGVSRLVLDKKNFSVKSSNMVLTGTARNCAGGQSPWGWLTCEETLAPGHGYVFVCDVNASSLAKPNRIKNYGRFNHEAAVVDPTTRIAYLTEDQGDSCFYRFLPDAYSTPFEGKLQALKIKGKTNFLTHEDSEVGKRMKVEWVDIDSPDTEEDSVRFQGQEKGAAVISRGEGLSLHKGEIYFCSTNGGPEKGGQIFRLIPGKDGSSDQLQLLAQSEDRKKLDMPDNIYVSSKGHVFMAEDGKKDQFIRILKADGTLIDFARNSKTKSEIAGVCLDPSEKVLFCNLQKDGLTVAITGPFDSL